MFFARALEARCFYLIVHLKRLNFASIRTSRLRNPQIDRWQWDRLHVPKRSISSNSPKSLKPAARFASSTAGRYSDPFKSGHNVRSSSINIGITTNANGRCAVVLVTTLLPLTYPYISPREQLRQSRLFVLACDCSSFSSTRGLQGRWMVATDADIMEQYRKWRWAARDQALCGEVC